MILTKIKRRDLIRGDIYASDSDIEVGVPRVYVAFVDGITPPINVANETIYRIDTPDYIHELTQFSWKLKQLDDRIETTVSPREVNIETEYELRKELAGRQGSIDGLNQIVAIRKKDDIRHKRRVKELETRIKDLQWNLAQQTELTSAFQKSIDTYRERAAEHRLKNVVRDQEINELESELDDARRNQCVCSDPTGAQQLDLLDDILKIANTTIHQKMRSPYHKNDAFDGDRMREVCDVVTDFRRRHNIVG